MCCQKGLVKQEGRLFQRAESNIYHDCTQLILPDGMEQKDHTPLIKRWG